MEKLNKLLSRRMLLLISALLVLGLVLSSVGGTSAKYVKDAGEHNALVRAREFYFSSDLLMENGASYTLNSGTESVTFSLRNHDDDLRYSEEAITYSVTVDNSAVVSPASGKLTGIGDDSSKTVTLSGLTDGTTYTVTAKGSAGYEKTLWATFEVKAPGNNAYYHLDASDPTGKIVLLTVWTENVSGDVKLSFPAGLIPDATDPKLANIKNYDGSGYTEVTNGDAGSLGVYSSHTYRFFREHPYILLNEDELEDQITVFVGETKATEEKPH